MRVQQLKYANGNWVNYHTEDGFNPAVCQLVLAFGSKEVITDGSVYEHLEGQFPEADIAMASTAGEILGSDVLDDTVVVTAIQFDRTEIKSAIVEQVSETGSFETGVKLMDELAADDLVSVFVLSDGAYINGSELVSGLNKNNSRGIPVTGGLAGDGTNFNNTVTGLNGVPGDNNVVAIGFYGSALRVGHGSVGGWDEFGPERTITASVKNVLHELDGRNALDLYKEYLGDYVNDLPGSALLFPISIKMQDMEGRLVRTILAVDDVHKTMTFAGNMPIGARVRLMKANFDRLIGGSSDAAVVSFNRLGESLPKLAILISCVGRKLVLQHRIDEEVEAAREVLGSAVPVTGFYSYGEISPLNPSVKCELHNQTMTITTFTEI